MKMKTKMVGLAHALCDFFCLCNDVIFEESDDDSDVDIPLKKIRNGSDGSGDDDDNESEVMLNFFYF